MNTEESLSLSPGYLSGSLEVPFSKSLLHRALIGAALSGDTGRFSAFPTPSDDIRATRTALSPLLSETSASEASPLTVDCCESGTTLRLLLPIAAALGLPATFLGSARLPFRPLQPYAETLTEDRGVSLLFPDEKGRFLPLSLRGKLQPGEFSLPGNVSSQFISGFLFALPLLSAPSVLRLTSPLESASYVEMTLSVLRAHGVSVERRDEQTFFIPAPQRYRGVEYEVEADASQQAFWQLANFLGSSVSFREIPASSIQGDACFSALLRKLRTAAPEDCVTFDVSQTPDLVPALAAAAAHAPCAVRIAHAERLRIKESDRLATTCAMLRAFGSAAEERPDGLLIPAGPPMPAGPVAVVDGANDHRIVMAAAMLATRYPCRILGPGAVSKSYPAFFNEYFRLRKNTSRS